MTRKKPETGLESEGRGNKDLRIYTLAAIWCYDGVILYLLTAQRAATIINKH
jgi:hypothetical protein